MRLRALSAAVLASIAVAGCSARDDGNTTTSARPTQVATVSPGGIVPWADLPLPLHPVMPAPPTVVPSLLTPMEVRAGEVLSYQLLLRNVGTSAYKPSECPVYLAWLQDATAEPVNIAGEPLTLNCALAGPIPAGGETRFEMQFWVPESTPAGQWDLVWTFAAYAGRYGAEARASVHVRR